MIRYIICLLAFALAITACKKKTISKTEEIQNYNTGHVNAQMNGEPWSLPYCALGSLDGKLGLGFGLYQGETERQTFDINLIDFKIREKIKIHKHIVPYINHDCTAIFYSVDDDAIEDIYIVLEDSLTDNFVMIDSYDENTKYVKGVFQLTFYREHIDRVQVQGLPDTMRFMEGKFEGTIK